MGICMQKPLFSLLLNLVLSVGKVMLPIEDLMVDGEYYSAIICLYKGVI
jgi:hypothetical protein